MLSRDEIAALSKELENKAIFGFPNDEIAAGIYRGLVRSTIENLNTLWFYNEALVERASRQ